MIPLEGIIGGPIPGGCAALIGVLVGRIAKPEFYFVENLFGIGEVVGAFAAGLLFAGRWKTVFVIYVALLIAFLLHPIARVIPLWTLWDVYVACLAVFPAAYVTKKVFDSKPDPKTLLPAIALTSFISVELDVMVRIFMLIVMGLYQVYPIPIELIPGVFIAGAFVTPLEAMYTSVMATIVGVPILISLERTGLVRWPFS